MLLVFLRRLQLQLLPPTPDQGKSSEEAPSVEAPYHRCTFHPLASRIAFKFEQPT